MTLDELLKNTNVTEDDAEIGEETSEGFKFLGCTFTNGGPFVFIPEKFLKNWSGTYGFEELKMGLKKLYEGEKGEEDDFMDPKKTHYGIACEDEEDFGKKSIEIKDRSLNVFTLFSSIEQVNVFQNNSNFIFRLGFSLDEMEDEVAERKEKVKKEVLFEKEYMEFEDYVIFDSAYGGFEEENELLKIKMPVGNYAISKVNDGHNDIYFVLFEKLED